MEGGKPYRDIEFLAAVFIIIITIRQRWLCAQHGEQQDDDPAT